MEMLDRRPCGSGTVAEGKQGMMTAEINQSDQLTSPLQVLPPFSSLSELDAYQMEQMIMCYRSVLSNRQPQAGSPAGFSTLQPPLNTPDMKPAGDDCFPKVIKTRNNAHLMKEQSDHYRPNDHKKRYLLQLKKIDPSNILVKVRNLFSRRRNMEESISLVTRVPYDVKLWRKYGQKSIRGAKQPRSYFRCSYRKERGCQAKKTVQQDDKDETKYHVVYTKPHTCCVAVQLHAFPSNLPIESLPEILSSNYSGRCSRSSFVDMPDEHQICPPNGICFGSSSIDVPGKHQNCPLYGKCIRSSSVDIPGEHQICPPSVDQSTPATGDAELMQNSTMLSSEVATPIRTPGTLQMINNDEMLGYLPTLESVELDDDSLMAMIDELCMSEIYI